MTAGLRTLLAAMPRARRIRAHGATRGAVRAYALALKNPPTEIQLWDVGDNPTDYGVHRWTDRSIQMVMARYETRGNPLLIDVDHNYSSEEVPVDGTLPSGGYARLEIRDDAPWLVFDWSAYGVEQIVTGQRLFLSPEYDVDPKTGEIIALIRVSLVADPATHHARRLARVLASAQQGEGKMNLAMMLAALSAANSAEDPKVAQANVAAFCEKMSSAAGGDGDGAGDAPPKKDGDGEQAADAGDPPAPPVNDEDKKKKEEAARASAAEAEKKEETARAAASAKRIAPPDATPREIVLAQTLAGEIATRDTKIADLEKRDAARAAREKEEAAKTRVAAHADKIPEALRAFALALPEKDFEVFVKGLPEGKASPAKRMNAAARPAHGNSRRPEGDLDDDTKRHLARAFNDEDRPEYPVEHLEDGRLRLTCLARIRPGTPVSEWMKNGVKEGAAQ